MVALATHLYGHIDHLASLAILAEAATHVALAAHIRRQMKGKKDDISKSAQKRANRRHH